MNREEFRRLALNGLVILDGATGMNLVRSGMPAGVCPEQWILDNPDVIVELKKSYVEAGSNIIDAATFAANRIKLAEYGLENKIQEINTGLVKLAKKAASNKAYVAGNLTMTGEQLYPMGKMHFEELVNIYKEQISYILMEGVDLFVVETMMSLQECRAAVLAIKETCDLPVMVNLTFNEDERTLYGTNPETAAVVLQAMGVDAVGVNCSTGPDKMAGVVRRMAAVASIPVAAKPNAGLPRLDNGVTVYDTTPEEFAYGIKALIESGASIVGGCCGTTPEHILKMVKYLKESGYYDTNYKTPYLKCVENGKHGNIRALTTERQIMNIELDGRFMVVGERINPTGKKMLQAELKNGIYDMVASMAEEQVELGADVLDINVGMSGIDEKETMLNVINEVMGVVDIPLAIDSSYIDVIESALRIYPGRALINSISLEKEKFEKLIPIAKKYGAMFILLPLSDKGLPENIDEKKEIINKIIERAYSLGLTKNDIIVDGLVATVGANKNAAIEVLETINYCRNELGLATICGLSNISFGLPERQFVNSTFLAFAIKEGLTMAIANPSQNLLMNTAFAADLLRAKPESDVRYINRVNEHPMTVENSKTSVKKTDVSFEGKSDVFVKIVKGNKRNIVEAVKEELDKGTTASEVLDSQLIPAINYVGELFDKKTYFLPQLIASAEAMKIAIDYVEPMLSKDNDTKEKDTIVIATVEGDIHDIGKNLVTLMLKNYGYNVIDLGKDVPAEIIIEQAKKNNAKIIALSALMTTTMMQMKEVVRIVKERKLNIKVIIGGAVVTGEFAKEINADGYSYDAQEAVTLVKELLQ